MSVRIVPIIELGPGEPLTAEHVVKAANGELKIFINGEEAAICLPRKDRVPFRAAITLKYLKHSRKQPRLAEVYCYWCEAKQIPCVSFEIEDDCVEMMAGTDGLLDKDDPFVVLHFDAATSGHPFTRKGLVAVTGFLLGHVWDLTLSPWKISAGAVRFSVARQLIGDLHKIWEITRSSNAEKEMFSDFDSNSARPPIIH